MKLLLLWLLRVSLSMKLAELPETVTLPLRPKEPTVAELPLVVVRRPPFFSSTSPMALNVVVFMTRVMVPPSAISVTGVL